MLEQLFGTRADRLNQALDKTSNRQTLLMKNLANINTPGYTRQDSDFNVVLSDEIDGFDQIVAERQSKAFAERNASLRTDGNSVDMEHEVMSITETETRYNALSEFTSRYFSGLKNVIREGR